MFCNKCHLGFTFWVNWTYNLQQTFQLHHILHWSDIFHLHNRISPKSHRAETIIHAVCTLAATKPLKLFISCDSFRTGRWVMREWKSQWNNMRDCICVCVCVSRLVLGITYYGVWDWRMKNGVWPGFWLSPHLSIFSQSWLLWFLSPFMCQLRLN